RSRVPERDLRKRVELEVLARAIRGLEAVDHPQTAALHERGVERRVRASEAHPPARRLARDAGDAAGRICAQGVEDGARQRDDASVDHYLRLGAPEAARHTWK